MKKKIILLLVIVVVSLSATTQTFEKVYQTNLDDAAYDALELPNGNFMVLIDRGNFFTSLGDFMLLTLDTTGKFIDSLVYPGSKDYSFYGAGNLFSLHDSVYICTRLCKDNAQNRFINFIKFDSSFNVLLDTVVGNVIPEMLIYDYVLTHDNEIVITAFETVNYSFFLYEFNLEINALSYHPIIDTGGIIIKAPLVLYDLYEENKFQVYMGDGYNSIHEIDRSNYTIDTTYYYTPQGLVPREAIHGFNDSSYLVAGSYWTSSQGGLLTSAFFTITNDGNILDYHNFDLQNDTSSYLVSKCFITANNRIYMASSYNYTSEYPFTIIPEQRWIWLMCLYPDGTLDWQRFYKGEVNYMPYKLVPASDGGLLIVSNKYDWNDPVPYQRDVHILKVDSTGWYVGIPTGVSEFEQQKQVLVYPNPVQDKVKFVLGYLSGLQLEIFNSNGVIVRKAFLAHSSTVDMSGLPAGLYLYMLRGNNGFVEKGKLIKQ